METLRRKTQTLQGTVRSPLEVLKNTTKCMYIKRNRRNKLTRKHHPAVRLRSPHNLWDFGVQKRMKMRRKKGINALSLYIVGMEEK